MRNLVISQAMLDKLANKHHVDRREVEQCFENLNGPLLVDNREEHKTDPQTLWFLSKTNKNRLLKVAYIQRGQQVYLKTCYEPNEDEIHIYSSHTKRRI